MKIRDRIIDLRRVPASSLIPNPKNWRKHPQAQQDALRGALAEIGYASALLAREVPEGLKLIDGHLRAETTPDEIVPVLVLDVDEKEADKLLATFDPLSAMAEADSAKLDELLKSIETESPALQEMLDKLSADQPAMLPEPGGGGDEFDATPEQGPTRTSVGDLWLIGGKHRLLVGDCTVAANVERLMGGEQVGLCFTSPPYAQQRDYGEAAKEKCQDWMALMCGAFACLPMTDAGQVLVNLGLIHREGEWVPYWEPWIEWMREQGWRRFGWYVWDQLSGFPGVFGGRCAPSHEFIFHFNHDTTMAAKHIKTQSEGTTRTGGQMGANGWEDDPNRIRTTGEFKIPDSVWRSARGQDGSIEHSAKFPVALPTMAIQTWPADVYDPFLGSGTTLIAAHRLNRRCYGCEIEPRYGDVILKRCEAEGLAVERI